MTDVKLKAGYGSRNRNITTINYKDNVKRKPFDLNAIGSQEENVSFDKH